MGNLEIAKEAVNLYFEGFSAEEAISKAKRECLGVDQNNQSTHEITFKNILPLGTDLDNGEVYDKLSEKMIREL